MHVQVYVIHISTKIWISRKFELEFLINLSMWEDLKKMNWLKWCGLTVYDLISLVYCREQVRQVLVQSHLPRNLRLPYPHRSKYPCIYMTCRHSHMTCRHSHMTYNYNYRGASPPSSHVTWKWKATSTSSSRICNILTFRPSMKSNSSPRRIRSKLPSSNLTGRKVHSKTSFTKYALNK